MRLFFVIAALMLAACATPSQPYSERAIDFVNYEAARSKSIKVSAPIFRANAEFCSKTRVIDFADEPPFEICAQKVRLAPGTQINAHTDGQYIVLSEGAVMRLSQDELAFMISHELAHDIAGHDMAAGSKPNLELEADGLAIAIMHRAGFNARAVPPFMERAGFANRMGSATHPPGAARQLAVKEALDYLGL